MGSCFLDPTPGFLDSLHCCNFSLGSGCVADCGFLHADMSIIGALMLRLELSLLTGDLFVCYIVFVVVFSFKRCCNGGCAANLEVAYCFCLGLYRS